MIDSPQFKVHLKCVEMRGGLPWAGPERFEAFVTPIRTHESRIVGQCILTSSPPFDVEEYLLDFSMPSGERRLHYVEGPERAQRIIEAAYNVASHSRDQSPADELAFRRVKSSDSDTAEITLGGKRVGCIVIRGHDDSPCQVTFDRPTPYGADFDASSFDHAVKRVREKVWPRPPGSENFQNIFMRPGRGDDYVIFREPQRYGEDDYEDDYEVNDERVRIGSASAAAPINNGLLVSYVDPQGKNWYFRAKDGEAATRYVSERYNVGYHDGDPDELVNRSGVWEVVPGPITLDQPCDVPLFIRANGRHIGTAQHMYGGGALAVELDFENGTRHVVHSFAHARRVTAERLEAAAKVSLGEVDE